jgi:cell wall assembly regulator SMI1
MLRELFPNGRFSPAATPTQIESVETDLGVRLPEQLRRLYLECDGFREDRGNSKSAAACSVIGFNVSPAAAAGELGRSAE